MSNPPLIEDLDLEQLFQAAIVGITGLPSGMVRPRFQPTPPRRPELTEDWCAIGDVADTADFDPWIEALGPDPGTVRFWRHEQIDLLASFYGPHGKSFAKVFRDGIKIPQNMEALEVNNIALVDTGPIRRAPEYINQQWYQRYDMTLSVNRKIERIYGVNTFKVANIHLFDDTFLNAVIAVQPKP